MNGIENGGAMPRAYNCEQFFVESVAVGFRKFYVFLHADVVFGDGEIVCRRAHLLAHATEKILIRRGQFREKHGHIEQKIFRIGYAAVVKPPMKVSERRIYKAVRR